MQQDIAKIDAAKQTMRKFSISAYSDLAHRLPHSALHDVLPSWTEFQQVEEVEETGMPLMTNDSPKLSSFFFEFLNELSVGVLR